MLACSLLVMMLLGPLQPLAQAAAPGGPTPEDLERTRDAREFSAGVLTAVKAPLNVALCAVGVASGIALMAVTMGYGYQAAWSAMHEGCDLKWVVTGDDLVSKESPVSHAFEWETHRFDWEDK